MKRTATLVFIAFILSAQLLLSPVWADTFGSGANSFQIDFVTIGNPGNPADTTGSPQPAAGSVPYEYRIGKYEISEQMIEKANAEGGLGITKDSRGPDKPATSVDWFEAAKFVNWLNTSAGSSPAYKFDGSGNFQFWQAGDPGYNPNNLYRNTLATYFLPSVHEWYKAAYYNPATGTYFDYPTGSNGPPVAVANGTAAGTAVYLQSTATGPADITVAGGLSPYGTMAQGGNIGEWEETDLDLLNDSTSDFRGIRGGAWGTSASALSATARAGGFPSITGVGAGFRVASVVPEPAAMALIVCGCFTLLGIRQRIIVGMMGNTDENLSAPIGQGRLMKRIVIQFFMMLILTAPGVVRHADADTFGSGASTFDIDFVTIGNPGNPSDIGGSPNMAGAVPYEYRIGKYEISEQMIEKANAEGGLGITKDSRGPDRPATSVDWFEAAKFVNWLNASTGSLPAYKFDGSGNFQFWQPGDSGYNPNNLYRNSLASYFLPSVHEWYKAAYYNPATGSYFDYPTGSNNPPTAVASGTAPGTAVYLQSLSAGPADIMFAGGPSLYDTMAQGGNVVEWEETDLDLVNDSTFDFRGRRGGAWEGSASALSATARAGGFPSTSLNGTGFRVGSIVPEPSSTALLSGGFLALFANGRRSRKRRCNDAKLHKRLG